MGVKLTPRMLVSVLPGPLNPVVGTVAIDSVTGARFIYVTAGAAIAQFDAVRLNATLADVRPTSAANQFILGVAPEAIASGASGWIQTEGQATAKVVAATAANSPLVSTATAGTLGLADATAFGGVKAVAQVEGVAAGSSVYLR